MKITFALCSVALLVVWQFDDVESFLSSSICKNHVRSTRDNSIFGMIKSNNNNNNNNNSSDDDTYCDDTMEATMIASTNGRGVLDRRGAMKKGASAVSAGSVAMMTGLSSISSSSRCEAAEGSMVAGEEVAKRMKRVPVFAIVDGTGVPFATYDKGGGSSATGYFFTTYAAAQYVLEDARKAFEEAKAAGKDTVDSWGESRIVTVSLAMAMQLSVKKQSNVAQNGNKITTYYQTMPGASELTLASKLENNKSSARFAERGRVPLFYFPQLTLPNTNTEEAAYLPLYFDPKGLLDEWKTQYPDVEPPPVKVRELTEVFYAMLKPGGDDESVKNMIFIPTSPSLEAVKDLQKINSSDGIKYKIGDVVLTG